MPAHINEYYNYLLERGISANTIKRHHANINKCLKQATMRGVIPFNPASRVELPKIQKYEAKILTPKQMSQLLELIKGDPIETAILFAIYYGMRKSEILGLKWSDINFEEKIFEISATRKRVVKEVYEEKTKSDSSYRIMPLSQEMSAHLKALRIQQMEDRFLFGNAYHSIVTVGDTQMENDFVCRWRDGHLLGCGYVSKHFKLLMKKCGFPPVTFHGLRHSCASALSNSNQIAIEAVQGYLGHSDIQMTRHYIHPDQQQKFNANNVMTKIIKQVQ